MNGTAALRLVGAVAIGRQAGLGLAALLTIAVAARLPVLAGGQIDYDEGVYWQSLRAMAAGHPLFTSVYSSQPPAFLMLLFPAHLLLGGSIQADRAAMVAFSVVGMVAAHQLGTLLESRWTGLVAASVLAVDPLSFRESVTLQADGPAIALALAGLALAAAGRRRDDQAGTLLAAAAGLTFATGLLVKPLAAPALPALAILLASPGSGRHRLLQIGAAAVGAGVAACGFLLPFADRVPQLQDELVGFHARARVVELGGLDAPTALTELPLVALALAGVAAGLRRQPLLVLVGGTWAVSGALLLALHRPLWPHHALVLVAPLAMLGAGAGHLVRGAPARLRVCLVLLLVALLASTLWIHAQQTSDGSRSRAVSAVKRVTEPNQFVITDDQYTVGLANRSTPPELVDTSKVRVLSGDLTLDQLDAIASRPDVCAVLVDDHYVSLSLLPGFRDWLDRRFPVARPLGEGRVLYLRTPPRGRSGPVSAAGSSAQATAIPPSGQGCGLRARPGRTAPAPRSARAARRSAGTAPPATPAAPPPGRTAALRGARERAQPRRRRHAATRLQPGAQRAVRRLLQQRARGRRPADRRAGQPGTVVALAQGLGVGRPQGIGRGVAGVRVCQGQSGAQLEDSWAVASARGAIVGERRADL